VEAAAGAADGADVQGRGGCRLRPMDVGSAALWCGCGRRRCLFSRSAARARDLTYIIIEHSNMVENQVVQSRSPIRSVLDSVISRLVYGIPVASVSMS